MPDIVAPEIESYAEAHTTVPSRHLVALAERTRAELAAPGMMVGAVEGRFLEMLVFALGARRVLEIGTFSGYSAIAMAACLAPGGTVTTCELNPVHAAVAREAVAAAGYGERVEILEGPALKSVAALDGPFDFVFIDADKCNYLAYFEAVLPKLAPGGLIAADNTLWGGNVLDEADLSEDTLALRAFNDALAGDERVVCVQLTVRDGVTLVRRAPGR